MTTPRAILGTTMFTLLAALLGGACTPTTVFEGDPGGETCADFADEQNGRTVTLRFTNGGEEPIFLGNTAGCIDAIDFEVRTSDGEPLVVLEGSCLFTCEELQSFSGGCTAGCILPPVYMLRPGEHYDFNWQGTVFTQTTMPGSCFLDDGGNSSCLQERVAPPGVYQVSVRSWQQVEGCDDGPGSGNCACTNDGAHCVLPPQAQLVDEPSETMRSFDFGDEQVVVIDISATN